MMSQFVTGIMLNSAKPGKTFLFLQPARKYTQSYHDYASFCQTKHDVYSVLSTEGGLNVNIVYSVELSKQLD